MITFEAHNYTIPANHPCQPNCHINIVAGAYRSGSGAVGPDDRLLIGGNAEKQGSQIQVQQGKVGSTSFVSRLATPERAAPIHCARVGAPRRKG